MLLLSGPLVGLDLSGNMHALKNAGKSSGDCCKEFRVARSLSLSLSISLSLSLSLFFFLFFIFFFILFFLSLSLMTHDICQGAYLLHLFLWQLQRWHQIALFEKAHWEAESTRDSFSSARTTEISSRSAEEMLQTRSFPTPKVAPARQLMSLPGSARLMLCLLRNRVDTTEITPKAGQLYLQKVYACWTWAT